MTKEEARILGRLETKVDTLLSSVNTISSEVEAIVARVNTLEKKNYAIVTIASIAFTGLIAFVNKFVS